VYQSSELCWTHTAQSAVRAHETAEELTVICHANVNAMGGWQLARLLHSAPDPCGHKQAAVAEVSKDVFISVWLV